MEQSPLKNKISRQVASHGFTFLHSDGGFAKAPSSARIFGGKGAALLKIAASGLKTPPGFIIPAELFTYYYQHNKTLPEDFYANIESAVAELEAAGRALFSNPDRPFLVSVRSAAAVSMPGMTDSLLNVGLNDRTYRQASRYFPDEQALTRLYAEHVSNLAYRAFGVRAEEEAETPADIALLKQKVTRECGVSFPESLTGQVIAAVCAVLNSHENPRAAFYRKIQNISFEDSAVAVIVQAMVYGNGPGVSGSGVALSRNPVTGEARLKGEYIPNRQGEAVVGGRQTPRDMQVLAREHPALAKKLKTGLAKLERIQHDVTEAEFTFEDGALWFLQARTGKSGASALLRITADLFTEQAIDEKTAILRINPQVCDTFLHAAPDPKARFEVLDKGVAASPGTVSGKIVFTAEDASVWQARGESVILVRNETSSDDIHGVFAAAGVLTARGGATSHAAVAARGLGRPCVTGAGGIRILTGERRLLIGELSLKEGDEITINGTTGDIIAGKIPIIRPDPPPAFYALTLLAEKRRRMQLRANADTAEEAALALRFGARGVGLCRTEQILFDEKGVNAVRHMILAETERERVAAFDAVRERQIETSAKMFGALLGLPMTVRLLDPPLHEFFPDSEKEIKLLAEKMGKPFPAMKSRLRALKEYNPMLGHRGCRIAVSHPEIYRAQVEMICAAAILSAERSGVRSKVELMIPFVCFAKEFETLRAEIEAVAEAARLKSHDAFSYKIGAMIELPRAALRADVIARHADFISFGTNDLTQTVLGVSRDDSARFLTDYQRRDILSFDPFVRLDLEGVGFMIEIAAKRARSVKPEIEIGVCGEHAADPESVLFFEQIGADYLSCSPYRVPSANFSAARARIMAEEEKHKHKNRGVTL